MEKMGGFYKICRFLLHWFDLEGSIFNWFNFETIFIYTDNRPLAHSSFLGYEENF